jgi:hypothetical protein
MAEASQEKTRAAGAVPLLNGRPPQRLPPHSFYAQYILSSNTEHTVICYLQCSVKAQATRPFTRQGQNFRLLQVLYAYKA